MGTSIEDFAAKLRFRIKLQYPMVRIQEKKYWGATLVNEKGERVNFKDSDVDPLSNMGAVGFGNTPNQAIDDLCKVYRGKILIFQNHKLSVPRDLSF